MNAEDLEKAWKSIVTNKILTTNLDQEEQAKKAKRQRWKLVYPRNNIVKNNWREFKFNKLRTPQLKFLMEVNP